MPFALTAQAAVNVNFDFTGASGIGTMVDNKYTSGPITVDGLTLTIATEDDWWSSTGLEGESSGLYIVSEDGNALTFSFDKAVRITGFVTNGLSVTASDEEARFTWGTSGSHTEKSYSQGEIRTTTLSAPIELAAGQLLTITSINSVNLGDGITMQSLQVTVVPEPAVYGLGLGLLTLGVVVLRRRRAACG